MKQLIKKILIVFGIIGVLGICTISFILYAMWGELEQEALGYPDEQVFKTSK